MLFESITATVISSLDIGVVRFALLEYEAIAILHAMALESIVRFFV